MSHDDFLASLALHVTLDDPVLTDLPRFAQLVAKTNQFTLGGPRRSEAEVTSCLAESRYVGQIVSASDRFGDYGVIGAIVLDRIPPHHGLPAHVVLLDTFVLSCRAMGRGIEFAMLASAFDLAGTDLWTMVHVGPKNAPAREFFAGFGSEPGRLCPLRRTGWPSHITVTTPTLLSQASTG